MLIPSLPSMLCAQRITAGAVKVKAGELIVISAQAKGEVAFFWDAREFGPQHSRQDGKTLVLVTNKSGAYSVNVISWDDRKIENVLVEVEGGGPTPIDPQPPTPSSEFHKKLLSAWANEPAKDKEKVKAYSQLYFELSEKAKSGAYPRIVDLWADLSQTRAVRLGDTKDYRYLERLGEVIGADLNTIDLNDLGKAIDDGLRKSVSQKFKLYSDLLGGLR